ncbi:type II secretion system F family protein [Paenibacillus mucilaginosus]|uniref:Flp pilus assembly protein TadC n=3 Tax=Paenibacillus mucilaginosus TaxID=61624 RepID=H6NHQ6_9BACL|nr:type II secretion system F family protein [Paenibacillus mucilaginosus]AEI41605.1 Flp pilus assembly protein TadC [Paenibacillus mucilaginosus KNP414]AFC30127.1 Flp pilus assembly protein TadC [Paenibacillus mucilaginosus 3016]AFH62395.1 pilus assembly protein TadC [Paenibacillus mucilaginosus K02]MCG7215368.1 type II secretion system F family protein [Paenibacillus mucilaginosus]WDM30597.1 type II secretion system F family protein [Paenibacillus mucilaginosus]
MVFLSFFLTVTLSVYALFVIWEQRRGQVRRRLAMITSEGEPAVDAILESGPPERGSPARSALLASFAKKGWVLAKRRFGRRMTEAQATRLEMRLLQAGRPFGMGTLEFRMLQLVLYVLLPTLFGLYGALIGAGFGGTVLFAGMGLAGAGMLPPYYLRLKTKQRLRLSLRELPDVLDMLTVSLEAGLGFDAALSKLVAKSDGVLPGEFRYCLEEIRLGKTRREALSGVRDRLPLDELRVLISSILQAEKLGIGMVQVLRVQSHEVREQRKQRAEEEAMKAPIKMLFPLILFIFPSLFIVLLGPAVIQFIEAFSK